MFESVFKWFKDILSYYGLYNKCGRLIFLGLDDAGKTTLLHLLKENRLVQDKPTLHPTSEELVLDSITFTTYDLGGHDVVRKVWREYFPIADAIIFIIDVSKRSRFLEAKNELDCLLCQEEIIERPILILGNKIDSINAANETEIKDFFNLNLILTGKKNLKPGRRPIELFMCSMKKREGYGDGIRWLANFF